MKSGKKVLYVFVALALVLSVVGISVGFAAMSTQLTINGTAEVTPATWKIKFENVTNITPTGGASVTTAPAVSSDTHIGNYAVALTMPGDQITYDFDVTNAGDIDAELTTYTFATPTVTGTGATATDDATLVTNNLVYTLTYKDGTAISVGDKLAKGATKTLTMTIGYSATAEAIPTNKVNITGMDVTFVYSQD